MAKISREFQVFAKPVGSICNLACRYCYYLQKEQLHPGDKSFRMSDDVLEQYIVQHIGACSGSVIRFSWHGGEPTVLGLDYFRKIVALQRKHKPSNRRAANGIQTNGTLLDEQWCRFLAAEGFVVGLSLDGPPELHDFCRVTKDDNPTHQKAIRGYEFLRERGVYCDIICVVNAHKGTNIAAPCFTSSSPIVLVVPCALQFTCGYENLMVDSPGTGQYNTPMNRRRQISPRASEKYATFYVTGRDLTAVEDKAIADMVISHQNSTTLRSLILLLSIFFVGQALAASSPTIEWRQVTPAVSDAVLFNPGMGLYMAGGSGLGYKPESDAWLLSVCDIVYFRPTWNDLEADGPGGGFDTYFQPIIDFWVRQRGKRVAFRVMSESTHYRGKYATPKWVFDRGVPSVLHRGLRGQEQVNPVFWDPLYLKLHCEFIQRLGRYLDDRSGLEYVDIGGIGEWGEMHLGLHMQGRWTPEQLEQTEFTREKYIAAYRQVIDAHAQAFPNARVFLNVGSYPEINDYAALRRCHFRQDGLTPSGPSSNVGKLYYHPYSRRGVICNYEFHSSYRSMLEKGWDLRETVEQGLSDPISYLNTNIFSPQDWEKAPEQAKELFLTAARKVGFRFVMTLLSVPTRLNLSEQMPGRLLIEHTWENIGVAPCYESYALKFTLHDGTGKIVATQQHFPARPTTLWTPGDEVVERTLIRFPAGLPNGDYELKVAMNLPEKAGQNILLGLAGRDEADQYHLCRLAGVTSRRPTGAVYRQQFESAGYGWSCERGLQSQLDATVFHDGKSSLHLSGRQTRGWNYVSHTLDSPIQPASKYRLSCWLKVNTMEPGRLPPYLKIGLTDSEGKWLMNCATNSYDMSNSGEWQRLEAAFETSLETSGGHLALERGSNDMATRIDLWLDNMQLELLEAP